MKIGTYHQICFIFCMAIFAYIVGCSTLRSDAKALDKDIVVDGKAIIHVAEQDGKQIATIALADLQNLATNPVLQAEVAKDLVTVAPLIVK